MRRRGESDAERRTRIMIEGGEAQVAVQAAMRAYAAGDVNAAWRESIAATAKVGAFRRSLASARSLAMSRGSAA